jgi:aldose 1-epimerase
LTAHPFFNLDGEPPTSISGHVLQIHAQRYVPVDAQRIPLGALSPVQGTRFDFRKPRPVGSLPMSADQAPSLAAQPLFDHAWVTPPQGKGLQCQAVVSSPVSGIRMEVWSDAPSIQFYSGGAMDGSLPRHAGKRGAVYGPCAGLCLEPQQLPDAPNHPEFGSCIHPPGAVIDGRIEYRFFSSGIRAAQA